MPIVVRCVTVNPASVAARLHPAPPPSHSCRLIPFFILKQDVHFLSFFARFRQIGCLKQSTVFIPTFPNI